MNKMLNLENVLVDKIQPEYGVYRTRIKIGTLSQSE